MADYDSYSKKETQRTLFRGFPIYAIAGSLPACRRVKARFDQLPRRNPIRHRLPRPRCNMRIDGANHTA